MLKYEEILNHKYKINQQTAKLPDETVEKIMAIVERLRIYNASDAFMLKAKQYKSKIKADNEEGKAIVFEVKKILNKLSEKTYEKLTAQLKTHLEKNIDESIMEEIIDLIFGITSKNKLHAEMFSKLYKDISIMNRGFTDVVHKKLSLYIDDFSVSTDIDPVNNYDEFCKFIKKNDEKICLSVFFAHLYSLGVIEFDNIQDLLGKSVDLFVNNVKYDDCHTICEEIVNNIYEIFKIISQVEKNKNSASRSSLSTHGKSKKKKNNQNKGSDIEWLKLDLNTKLNDPCVKQGKSYNNKIRFRIMDINDLFA